MTSDNRYQLDALFDSRHYPEPLPDWNYLAVGSSNASGRDFDKRRCRLDGGIHAIHCALVFPLLPPQRLTLVVAQSAPVKINDIGAGCTPERQRSAARSVRCIGLVGPGWWEMSRFVAVEIDGQVGVHMPHETGNYATFCGLDGDDYEQKPAKALKNARVDCPHCLAKWRWATEFRASDFVKPNANSSPKSAE